jgi:hypothetical protein
VHFDYDRSHISTGEILLIPKTLIQRFQPLSRDIGDKVGDIQIKAGIRHVSYCY